ncbi:MAG: hypothetical protein K6A41_02015 [Bacteroidales bacterium]|nr:hypothetical protein [Bacteroidales bacterium]
MEHKEIESTLKDIREMMSKSSQFQALSGWSIIIIGIFACIAEVIAAGIIGIDVPFMREAESLAPVSTRIWTAVILALVLLAVCFATVTIMSYYKAKKYKLPFTFDNRMRKMCINFLLPLAAGGIFSLAMILQGHYGLTSSIMLIFYGLALVNCQHYTYPALRFLGYGEILLGLIDCFVIHHAVLFWFLGFGVLHIIFGIIYITLYERKSR